MAGDSSKAAVGAAIGGNFLVMIAKFVAFLFTGSGAMFSEAIHSLADVLNQSLLMFGIVRSDRDADEKHPYGYGNERYIWALISAVGIFFLGCGFTLYHGIHSLLHPPKAFKGLSWAIGVLIVAFIIEWIVFVVAWRALKREAAGRPFAKFLQKEADPSAVAVLLEDFAACLGIVLALAGIGLTQLTGSPMWDALSSISIAILLGGVAVFLVVRNRQLLVGMSVPVEVQAQISDILESEPIVEDVVQIKGRMIDLKNYDIMAQIEFRGETIAERMDDELRVAYDKIENFEDFRTFAVTFAERVVDTLGDEIDALEEKIRKEIPAATHIDIEAE